MDYDYYEFLGVEKDATQAEIKKAFRQKSKTMHPDIGGDQKEFSTLTKAYETLSDPDKRAFYDRTGMNQGKSFDLHEAAENFIIQLFDNIIEDSMCINGEELMNALYSQCRSRIKARQKDLQFISRTKEGYEEKVGCILKDGEEETLFDRIIKDKIQRCEEEISLAQVDIQTIELAIKILNGYKPKPDDELKTSMQKVLGGYASRLLKDKDFDIEDTPSLGSLPYSQIKKGAF